MRLALASLFLGLGITASAAQDGERYQMEKTAEGYVRLDKQTGQMSICNDKAGQLVCKMAADDRSAFEDEVGRMQSRLEAVEKRLAALEAGGAKSDIPTEDEFEKTMSYMQRFFRGFIDIVKELDRDLRGPNENGTPAPDRT